MDNILCWYSHSYVSSQHMRIYVYFLLVCTNLTTLLASYYILQCTLVASLNSIGASQVVLMIKNLPADAGDRRDVGSIPGLGRYPGERKGDPLQYSCLENSLDRGAQQAIVRGVAESWTQLHTHLVTFYYKNFIGQMQDGIWILYWWISFTF